MSIGVILVTHGHLGEDLLQTVTGILGDRPPQLSTLSVGNDEDPERLQQLLADRILQVDSGQGVLLLTDIFGATPANVAFRLVDGERVSMVCGVNLPMLVRVLNYPREELVETSRRALGGGRDGVFGCSPERTD